MTERHDAPGRVGDTGSSCVIAVDAHGTVTAWSEAAEQLFGHSAAGVSQRPVAELFDEEEREVLEARLGAARPAEWSDELTARHREGRLLAAEVRATPLLDGLGRTQWFLTIRCRERATGEDDARLVKWSFEQSSIAMSLHDREGRVVRVNDEMARVLARPEKEMRGLRATDITPELARSRTLDRHITEVLRTGEQSVEEAVVRAPMENRERAWTVFLSPLKDAAGRVWGVCNSTLDVTEQYRSRLRLTVLNEASVRIGSVLDMGRTAEEAVRLVVPTFADFASIDLWESVHRGEEPPPGMVGGPVTLMRMAQASVLTDHPESAVGPGGTDTYPGDSPPARTLVTGRSSLRQADDPEVRAWLRASPERAEQVRRHGIHSMMCVPLRARGVTLGTMLYLRHQQPFPFDEEDLLLAEEIASRAAVCIDNARRYTLERTTAMTLQRSLLPGHLSPQVAVEVASRYLPASPQTGVGGDWFDVIPLSGSRVALVVGDVVGHGIHASATMGQLRTAVRTLADVELPPDELLTHLDDVVNRLEAEHSAADGERGHVGATCLYAVYDPVSRRCVLARAGHLAPVLVAPDGTADFVDLPHGPPLGLGGLPFESREIEVPEGSLLALYTDGLVESRERDIDEGLAELLRVLTEPAPSLEHTCDAVLKALLPHRPVDDIALLTVRTRALTADQVATWDLPADPAVVTEARSLACRQLAVWGLEEAAFVVELVVSELVTNAIRYGRPPIQLRLIHDDRGLICEVSDASSTAPHLRRARVYDEGGRGLLLVAQLTQAWGTRHTATGKTIWTELSPTDSVG
ncbi:SpoIIE family protein phosphatase [Streptomyces sp. NPDC096311]|uniref:SpoIIE family protein phosphatase n=1 Tax=Streptomyces sp. NPDC096311 TaxID=3366083 RepID=UPI003824CEB6